jgi:asparagine synthase (glutamine-hydrolysing)
MGGLMGVVRIDGGPVDRSVIERWKARYRSPSLRVRAGGSWASAYSPPPYLSASEPQPFDLASGLTAFIEGRIDERASLATALGIGDRKRSGAALIAAAYEKWGPTAHERLYGEFAVVLWDERQRTLTLVRDQLGTRALFYYVDGAAVWFATSLHLLLANPEVPRDLDELGLANFIVRASDKPERTLYRHIRRVPVGGTVTLRKDSCREQLYWTPGAVASVRLRRDEDYVDAARTLLDSAVASRLPEDGGVATSLSGGFDSAGITATAARLLGDRRLTAITRAAGAYDPYQHQWFDERKLAGLVAGRYPNVDWVVLDELHQHDRDAHPEWESAAMGMPASPQPVTWFEPVEKYVDTIGARTILDGGWGNATLSWTGDALCFEQVRGGRIASAVRDVALRARRRGKPAWPELRREMVAAIEPRSLRRWRRERKARGRGPWQLMAVFASDFLRSIDYGAHTDSIRHDILRKVPRSGRDLRWSMMHREVSADRLAYLRSTTKHEMLDPYRDRRLVEFTLGTPERQFQRDGVDRWLARRVLADRVPAEILAQTRQGVQNGEWYHMATLHRDQTAEAVERLARSPLACRVLDVNFLKTLVDNWPKNADDAIRSEQEHRNMLQFGVSVGSFLRWYEGSNG